MVLLSELFAFVTYDNIVAVLRKNYFVVILLILYLFKVGIRLIVLLSYSF
jgi:hypothetical protein